MRKADGLGSDFDFPEAIFFEELSYRDLEIRDLQENSLRVIIFPSHFDVLFFAFVLKVDFFFSLKMST